MLKFIPIKASAGIVGFESPATEYTQLSLDLDQLLIDHPSATYIGIAQGESMKGDGIFSGDLLIVDRAQDIKDQDVVVANLNGVFVCKKIDKKQRCLLSSSKRFPPYFLREGDDFQIEGVVTRSIRLHRPFKKAI
ncbi:translesion error-prone DNA polymerase V autoproteolytic subunit [Paraglaciecola mesophila]|jgi:DNA polymerase V|uniref:Protein impA n=2 Tax=Paraglaciecola mesophila TaxID=197222 RepID=K6YFB0_9ALTE|nr:translesion error-prone DNA polymerase V autoproteolytic subunit [Paraglaciecola mesophila]GAC22686.1 protein impA [Paraglaciecola mesophila KMM 241]|tara:strand:- start:683 stop:1087 length:405 start_codon:yes stop_codon:yes gene_type:complete